jgi:hypothetical protein
MNLKTTYHNEYEARLQKLVDEKTFNLQQATNSLSFGIDNIKQIKINRIDESINSTTPSLAAFRKYNGSQRTYAALMWQLMKFSKYMEVGKGMDDEKIEFTAELIMDDYYHLKFTDVYLCLKMGIGGKFGMSYDRMDVQTVMIWFEKYNVKRLEAAEAERLRERKKAQKEQEDAKQYAKMPESLIQLKNDLEKKWEEQQKFTPKYRYNTLSEFCEAEMYCEESILRELEAFHEDLKQKLIDISAKDFPSLKTHENGLMSAINAGIIPDWIKKFKKNQ